MNEEINFTEKIRISNIFIFVLLKLFMYFGELYALVIIFSFLHIIFNLLFFISELRCVILTKKLNYIYTNWIVVLGFIILFFELISMFLAKN